jgi:hypothetical protein
MNNIGIFIIAVGVLLFIIGGVSLGSSINETIPYMIFWFMYIISLATLGNIFLTIYYYFVMKDKTGPRGSRGPRGDIGDIGKDGQCTTGCRNQICSKSIKDAMVDVINKLERSNGNPNTDFTIEDIRNLYLKEKIKSMCESTEFQQLVPYKGARNLIAYMSKIWSEITESIYNAGGVSYFKTIGAENDWDWLDVNPWSEFKKYDIYYWGMTKDYRPKIKDKCNSSNIKGHFDGSKYPEHRHLTRISTSEPEGNYKYPSKKDSKYSIISYINTPSTFSFKKSSDGANTYTSAFNSRNKTPIKIYNAFTYKPSAEIQQKYEAGSNANKARRLKPMSYMIAHSKNDNVCARINNFGSVSYKTCNPYDGQQIFTLDFDKSSSGKMQNFKIIHQDTGKAIGHNNSGMIQTRNISTGDLYKMK